MRNCVTSQLVLVCKSNLHFECQVRPLQVDSLLHIESWIHFLTLWCLRIIIRLLFFESHEVCMLWQFELRRAVNIKIVSVKRLCFAEFLRNRFLEKPHLFFLDLNLGRFANLLHHGELSSHFIFFLQQD